MWRFADRGSFARPDLSYVLQVHHNSQFFTPVVFYHLFADTTFWPSGSAINATPRTLIIVVHVFGSKSLPSASLFVTQFWSDHIPLVLQSSEPTCRWPQAHFNLGIKGLEFVGRIAVCYYHDAVFRGKAFTLRVTHGVPCPKLSTVPLFYLAIDHIPSYQEPSARSHPT
jgi:hypothetical protein